LAAATILNDLSTCDLLIDATANPEVFLRMAAIAKAGNKPLCWGEVFAGGYGGLIARARPDLDPNPLAVRAAIHAFLATLPPAPFKQAEGYNVESDQPLIAHDCDVGQIATSLTRVAIDCALHSNPSQFPFAAYLVGMRKEWIFEQPFDTRPIDVKGDGWNELASPVKEEDRLAALKGLMELYEGTRNAESGTDS
jgi:sulfur-carrier protein adenylyltransferase/sulfurtransferase